MSSLTPNQVILQLEELEGWQQDGSTIVKTYQFATFPEALAFIIQASFCAQSLDHYPTWQNYYNQITVCIGNAQQGELHGRDIQLAKRLEDIYQPNQDKNEDKKQKKRAGIFFVAP